MATVPTIETTDFLNKNGDTLAACKEVARILIETGILVVRDPRVQQADNDAFLDTMEDYFNQPYDTKLEDVRPDAGYQVGATPDNTEVPRCVTDENCQKIIEKLSEDNKPHPMDGPDPKWRFFWKMGTPPAETKFPDLNCSPVIPKAFPNWEAVMNRWGTLMMEVCTTVAEMAAIGLGLEGTDFTSRIKHGPHLLAPTGSDIEKYNKLGTVFAGFHYDLNFLTIHGKSRYPGLYVWNRNGVKIPVRVPEGCLLVQAGKEIEYLTGGTVEAGYHEVVVNEGTLEAFEKAREKGRPTWRISSTLFLHIAADEVLQPLKQFANEATLAKYPPILTGDYVQNELRTINLRVK